MVDYLGQVGSNMYMVLPSFTSWGNKRRLWNAIFAQDEGE